MARLTLLFLGPFQAALDGHAIHHLLSPRIQGLLAYLALEATQPHPRELLAAHFWPNELEQAAKQNLRQALYQLRQQLGEGKLAHAQEPLLLVTRNSVQFNQASDYTLDVVAFVASVRARQYRHAVDLYQGELLSGLTSESVQFEEWLVLAREQMHINAMVALDQVTQTALAQSDFMLANTMARRQLALEPWREAAHRQLMLALAASGERSAALAQFDSCRRLLLDELNVAPDSETLALVEHIRSNQNLASAEHINDASLPSPLPAVSAPPKPEPLPVRDLGEAPDTLIFHGRQTELAELERWLTSAQSRLVAILGMGGIGKTAIAARLTRQVAGAFEFVIWRSLINAPPLRELLRGWLYTLSGRQLVNLPDSLDAQLTMLFEWLRAHRCLLVVDNAESIMQSGDRAGHYRAGYEEYTQLFKRVGENPHQSCLVITSREQPHEVARLERSTSLVRTLRLSGVDVVAGQAILRTQGVGSTAAATQSLIRRYSGNPLALMLVAETIQEIYEGDIDAFLGEEAPIFDDIRDVLDQQFARLSPLEQEAVCWFAIEREPVPVERLADDILQPIPKHALLEAINSLRRRSLLEKAGGDSLDFPEDALGRGFVLQNVVMEYVAGYLVDQIAGEIEQTRPRLLARYALIKAQAKEYIRQSQVRTILQPIAERLMATHGQSGVVSQSGVLLRALRDEHTSSYAGGNLLNLLLQIGADLRGYDFSGLSLRQAYLRGAELPEVDFSRADFTGSIFTDYAGAVTCVAFSPDGTLLVAGSDNGAIYLWQAPDWQLVGILEGHASHVWSLAFGSLSDPRRLLASGSGDMTVRIWDLANRRCIHILAGHTGSVTTVKFHPDGGVLASASLDQSVRVWDTGTGQTVSILPEPGYGVESVDFSPDGSILASGGHERVVRLWDWRHAEVWRTLSGHTGTVYVLRFSPCSNGADDSVHSLLASGSLDQTLCLWDARTGALIKRLTGHAAPVISATFAADGEWLVSGSDDQTARVWDVRDPEQAQTVQVLQGHFGAVRSVSIYPNQAAGQLLIASGSYDKTVRLWDGNSGRTVDILCGHSKWVQALVFTPDGQLLAAGNDGQTVRVWDGRTGHSLYALRGHTSLTEKVSMHSDGAQLASAGWDETVRIWDLHSGRLQRTLLGHIGAAAVAVAGADAHGRKLIASGGLDKFVRLWDTETGAPLAAWAGHEDRVVAFDFYPPGSILASGSWDRAVGLWDIERGELIHFLHGHPEPIECVAIDPSGELLASGSWYGSLLIWNIRTGELVYSLEGHTNGLEMVAFSADGAMLASCACDRLICVWDLRAHRAGRVGEAYGGAQLLYKLHGHSSWVRCVAFNRDGTLLASGSDDGTVRLWDITPAGGGACAQTIDLEDPYTGMNITGVTGISKAQRDALKALGAIEL